MVGAREVRTFGIAVIGLTLAAAVAWSLTAWFLAAPPARRRSSSTCWHLQLTPDQQFFLTAAGRRVGGLLHSLRSLSTYVGERYLFRSWLLYYLASRSWCRPGHDRLHRAAALLPGGASNSQPDPYGIAHLRPGAVLRAAGKAAGGVLDLFTNAPQNADSLSDLSSSTDDPGDPATQPVATALSPASGPAGTEVTVTGRNFGDVTGVAFAGVDAASFAITSPHQLTAVVPPAATTGPITLSGPTPLPALHHHPTRPRHQRLARARSPHLRPRPRPGNSLLTRGSAG